MMPDDAGMEVILPGGLLINGVIERKALFRPITGKIELALIEIDQSIVLPAYVSSVLVQVFRSIGNHAVNAESVNSLCIGDRQFLMLRLAERLGGNRFWLKAICSQCSEPFDVEVHRCDLPVKKAGRQFPTAKLNLQADEVEVRVPTAFDQSQTIGMSDDEAIRTLLTRCITRVNGKTPEQTFAQELTDEDIVTIDLALDELSPAVCNELLVTCPECHQNQSIKLNHYDVTGLWGGDFYNEIHTLAIHYHWSEKEILNMPRTRRRKYLDLIDRSKAMVGQVQ